MPIKLVARKTIVNFEEVSFLFDDSDISKRYLECVNNQIPTTEQGEYHHIYPKCKSLDNSEDNIVYISIETHFKCHYYLTFVKDKKLRKQMCFAFRQMLQTRGSYLCSENLDFFC